MTRIIRIFSTLVLCALFFNKANSQATITSSDGYTVNISIQPIAIVPSTMSCTWGYNYNVTLRYVISFTGNNIPSALWTLQGTVGCGTNSHFYSLPTNGGTGNLNTVSNVWNPNSDCATATPASLFCNTTTVNIQGPGIPSQSIVIPFVASGPLPVTITNFNTEAQKEKVKITWTTLSEINNDHFSIERSTDGIIWTTIKIIKGANNSVNVINYEALDEKPVLGTSYYRLKQTDNNGKISYSNSTTVKYTTGNNITAYPIPNIGNTVNFKGIDQPKNIQIVLRNTTGVSVYTTTLTAGSIELPFINPGIYTLSLNNKITGEVTNLRYVKL